MLVPLTLQPNATRKLLLNKNDDTTCCYLFPKKPNNRSLEVANEMRAVVDRANRSHDSSIRDVIMNRVSQLRRRYGNSVTGRKVDLVVESPLGTLPKLVGDLTIRHPIPSRPLNFAHTRRSCTKVAQYPKVLGRCRRSFRSKAKAVSVRSARHALQEKRCRFFLGHGFGHISHFHRC